MKAEDTIIKRGKNHTHYTHQINHSADNGKDMNYRHAQLPKGWEIKKLGEMSKITYGYTDSASDKEVGPKFLRITDIQDNHVDWNTVPYCKCTKTDFPKYKLDAGDIVFARTGATTGKSYLIQNPPLSVFASYLIRLKIKSREELLSEFVYLYFQTKNYWDNIDAGVSGSAQGGFNATKLGELEIPLPPLPEQKRIVAILDKVFAAIDKAKASTERNLQNAKELFESYLQNVFANPGEDWGEKRLGDIFEIKPPKNEAKQKLKGVDLVSFLPMEDLNVLANKITAVKERTLNDVIGSYTYFADNDVLLAKITPCFENGKIGIARNLKNGIGFGSSEYIVFRSKGDVLPEYLYFFLSRSQFRNEGKERMTGAVGHKRVSKEFIEEYMLPFPKSPEEQKLIVSKFDALSTETQKLTAIYQQKLNDFEELKQSVLQKAFSGQLTSKALTV